MSELDEAWALAVAEAERRARMSGRGDIAEYLALRNSNDFIRQTAVTWLGETFVNIAALANRHGASVQISRDELHRFKVGNSTMVGPLLTLSSGVRSLYIEAGWPREPRDGFVSGGGLARANVRHRGMKSADVALLLIRLQGGSPAWVKFDEHAPHFAKGSTDQLHESFAETQMDLLLDNPPKR